MTRTVLSPEQIKDIFTGTFNDGIKDVTIREWAEGVKKSKIKSIWIRLDRNIFHDAVKRLVEIDFPHLGVISGVDTGEEVELLYHFFIFFGMKNQEINVTFTVPLPKSDLKIPTIADIIPGAVYSEREKQDFLGVEVVDIPDPRRLFLTENFPENVYPWRKDETGIPTEMVKELWAVGRPTDRPAPPVKPKEEKKKEKETPAEKTPEEQKEGEIPAQKATENEEEVIKDE